jgi:hypothetical protein
MNNGGSAIMGPITYMPGSDATPVTKVNVGAPDNGDRVGNAQAGAPNQTPA